MVDSRNATEERTELRIKASCRIRSSGDTVRVRTAPVLYPVPKPAQDGRGLDIPDGETVAEPDFGFFTGGLNRDLIHLQQSIFSCKSKKSTLRNRVREVVKVYSRDGNCSDHYPAFSFVD